MNTDPGSHTDIAIIGAGPVGLLLANLLAMRGIRVHVVEERNQVPQHSMSIGITPPSLSIMKTLGLDRTFLERGIPVTKVKVFENGRPIGGVDFSRIPADYRCMLSLPQSETIALLRDKLKTFPAACLQEGTRFKTLDQDSQKIQYHVQDTETGKRSAYTASWLVGCDGHRSVVRERAGIPFPGRSYRARFCMADFEDCTDWPVEARLFFGRDGAVESFPLPSGRRRWIVQLPRKAHPDTTDLPEAVADTVFRRTGIDLTDRSAAYASWFQPKRHLAPTYAKGRVVLCGDAAHVMSPIGGQGMNTGFADASQLARILSCILSTPDSIAALLEQYTRNRRYAFNMAANRAERGMWLGTRTGNPHSLGRRLLMKHILLRPPVRDRLAACFAMLTTPEGEVSYVA